MRITDVDARIILACQTPKRPLELVKQFDGDISYSYLTQRLSVLTALDMLIRKNIRERGKSRSWYTVRDKKYVNMAENVLRDNTSEFDQIENKTEGQDNNQLDISKLEGINKIENEFTGNEDNDWFSKKVDELRRLNGEKAKKVGIYQLKKYLHQKKR